MDMMIYMAHPFTREFIGSALADPDPLTPGSWLIPADAYVDEPPTPPAGYAVRRAADHSEWEMVEDHRGDVYSTESGAPAQLELLGPIPEGWTVLARPSAFHDWAGAEWVHNDVAERAALSSAVDGERDRRIDAGIEFQSVMFQSRGTDRENIAGAAQLGFMAVVGGAQAGNLHWTGSVEEFAWIASDNTLVPMDAQTVVAFGKAAAERKQTLIFAARQLKDMQPIPADFTADKWWP